MTTNIEHAKEAGAWLRDWGVRPCAIFDHTMLDAFVERIRAAEQERCALLADSMQYARDHQPANVANEIRKCAQ